MKATLCSKCNTPHNWNVTTLLNGKDWVEKLCATLCPICKEEINSLEVNNKLTREHFQKLKEIEIFIKNNKVEV